MRKPRVKISGADSYYHLTSRTVGDSEENVLSPVEKEQLELIFRRLFELFAIRLVSLQVMGTHFHMVVHVPGELLSLQLTAERWNRYQGKRLARLERKLTHPMKPEEDRCAVWQKRLSDISWLMQLGLRAFTVYYNKRHRKRQGGTLWAGRFFSAAFSGGDAFRRCLIYVLANPVNAGLETPETVGSYAFSSLTHRCHDPTDPFVQGLLEHLRRNLPDTDRTFTDEELLALIHEAVLAHHARRVAEREASDDPTAAVQRPEVPTLLLPSWDRIDWDRVRAVGPPEFIREAVAGVEGDREIGEDYLHSAFVEDEPAGADEIAVYTGTTCCG